MMRKLDYILIAISYILIVITFSVKPDYGTPAVTNPDFSDYLVQGFGGLLGSFLFASVFTLPIQFFKGWNKTEYLSKTTKGMLIVAIISSLSIFA